MASLDAEDLVSNILVRETVEMCLGQLFSNPGATGHHVGLPLGTTLPKISMCHHETILVKGLLS